MSIRKTPPLPPCHPRRVANPHFAQLEFSTSRQCEVTFKSIGVGGAVLEVVGLMPPDESSSADLFVDIGADGTGHRVAGTLRADIMYWEVATPGNGAKIHVTWAGCDVVAAELVGRLLEQQSTEYITEFETEEYRVAS